MIIYPNNSHVSIFKDIGKHLVKIIFKEKMKKIKCSSDRYLNKKIAFLKIIT